MMVVSQNELKRKLSVGPGFIVDKTTLVLVKFTLLSYITGTRANCLLKTVIRHSRTYRLPCLDS